MTLDALGLRATHTTPITRQNPGCILFLLDQSGSMADPFALPGEPEVPRAKGVADVVNRVLMELVLACTKGELVYDRFQVGVVTYGGTAALAPYFQGLRPLSEVAENPLDVERRPVVNPDGSTSEVFFPFWFEPMAEGGTPMCEAIRLAHGLIAPWAAQHPESFPPIVFNISDGESTDGSPLEGLRNLQAVSTLDGPCLTFNCLLASGSGPQVVWPARPDQVPAGVLQDLFEGSSVLPDAMRHRAAAAHKLSLEPGARGVVLNAGLLDLVRLLDIGTPANGGGAR